MCLNGKQTDLGPFLDCVCVCVCVDRLHFIPPVHAIVLKELHTKSNTGRDSVRLYVCACVCVRVRACV